MGGEPIIHFIVDIDVSLQSYSHYTEPETTINLYFSKDVLFAAQD
jgi:hypothetical protein